MKYTSSIVIIFIFFTSFFFYNCRNSTEKRRDENSGESFVEDNKTLLQGKILATQHCQSCHLLPNPNLLDKENWQKALAMMAPRLGIYAHNNRQYPIFTDIDQRFYPDQPAMGSKDWQNIIEYYLAFAPADMPSQLRNKEIISALPFFSIELPPSLFYRRGNTASFVKIDTTVKPHRLFVNRAASNTFYLLNNHLQVNDSIVTTGPIVNVDFNKDGMVICMIGANLYGNNLAKGSAVSLNVFNGKLQGIKQPLFANLARPLQVIAADIRGQKKNDYLVCEFGNLLGSLSWMGKKGGSYAKHTIRSEPGATYAYLRYENPGKLADIWALFAQGEEGIFTFTNQGNGTFIEKQVLRFPPSYGSTSFELNDFNNDGFTDIVYTCGDRGDGILQLKPYHGVYIFINNGKNEFFKKYFFPINGCIKAMACDFDKDGDLDIAAIGLFTDNQQPQEGFIYLENKGDFEFQPYSLPLETNFTKATTMDVGDIDGDGKQDIILGHGFVGNKTMDDKKPLFIVLKNKF